MKRVTIFVALIFLIAVAYQAVAMQESIAAPRQQQSNGDVFVLAVLGAILGVIPGSL